MELPSRSQKIKKVIACEDELSKGISCSPFERFVSKESARRIASERRCRRKIRMVIDLSRVNRGAGEFQKLTFMESGVEGN